MTAPAAACDGDPGPAMAERTARVVAVGAAEVWLVPEPPAACAGCAAGAGCGIGRRARDQSEPPIAAAIAAEAGLVAADLRPGHRVVIGVPEAALLGAAVTVYLVPLGALIAGALALDALGAGDAGAALGAAVGLAFGLLVARLRSPPATGTAAPVVLRRAIPPVDPGDPAPTAG